MTKSKSNTTANVSFFLSKTRRLVINLTDAHEHINLTIFFFQNFVTGTLEGIKKFLETDGEYGKAAPDHDEL